MNAVLALEDGTVFRGTSAGAPGEASGEVVFNTSMTGYQEVLTDPSYAGQIVTMTSVQIGNYGITAEDTESRGPPTRRSSSTSRVTTSSPSPTSTPAR
jgi:carbamoyl-phosphate synthase small subunit